MTMHTLEIELDGIPLVVIGKYSKGEPERGARGFSLGTPAEPEAFHVYEVKLGKLSAKMVDLIAKECLEACRG